MSNTPFKSQYQEFIYTRTYSRWIEEENRRETWVETLGRYARFFRQRVPENDIRQQEFNAAMLAVYRMEVMPSMRALWAAGEALELENVAGYNCAYTIIDTPKSFAEIMYVLMCGTGVGFSTEEKYICQLPVVPNELYDVDEVIVVEDSRQGWAEAFYKFILGLYQGKVFILDTSKVRPKGARLKTFGGRASGAKPLEDLMTFTLRKFLDARGRKLNSLEVYDIVTMTASIVIAGGVRRSATINLSDLEDKLIRHAKEGQFWVDNPQRSLSNNSAVYNKKPTLADFIEEWLFLMQSGTGERGIVNREGLRKHVATLGTRKANEDLGVNPCGEVILRAKQFCNLSEVVIRPEDSLYSLIQKVKHTVILGILQSSLSEFNFLDDEWKKNTEEERLLGISLTGLQDHPILNHVCEQAIDWLTVLRQTARQVSKVWAEDMGINIPVAITSVKPSGTVSQLVSSASGIHPRFSPFYIRRVRIAAHDPLANMLKDYGVPCIPEVGQTWDDYTTLVFEFPIKSPEKSVFKDERSAIEQLEYWKMLKTYWTDHNPSITIYVREK